MPNIKRMFFVTLLSLFLFVSISYAEQNYQTEIIGGYEKEDADTSTDKTIELGVKIYFSPVNAEKKPLAQAAFLDKKSSILAGYINFKTDLKNSIVDSIVDSIDFDGPLIAINYITENDAFILGAAYSKLDGDTNPDLLTIDSQIIGFTVGKYINDSTTVQASYINSETEYRSTSFAQLPTLDVEYLELTYNTVQTLGAKNYYSFGIGFELTKKNSSNSVKEDNDEFKVAGGYYFSRMTSLDVGASFNSGDDMSDEGHTLAIGFTHFIDPQIALEVELSKFNADNNIVDTDSISFVVIARI